MPTEITNRPSATRRIADPSKPAHAMTVDVEDYFQVQAFAGVVDRSTWEDMPRRVEANTDRILALFDEAGAKATFFTLGWVADRHPNLVRRIVDAGHELASHGYGHQLVHKLTPDQFRQDVRRAKHTLEDHTGTDVAGYRAPTFSIGPANPWAFDVLAETGHAYSSSTYPVRHDLYGDPDAPRFAHRREGSNMLEIPMTTLQAGGRNLPISGGGYFRLTPYPAYRMALRRFEAAESWPAVFYFHPWEVDPGQPRIAGASRRSNFRHHVGIGAMRRRLARLLRDFAWDRMDRVFAAEIGAGTPTAEPDAA